MTTAEMKMTDRTAHRIETIIRSVAAGSRPIQTVEIKKNSTGFELYIRTDIDARQIFVGKRGGIQMYNGEQDRRGGPKFYNGIASAIHGNSWWNI